MRKFVAFFTCLACAASLQAQAPDPETASKVSSFIQEHKIAILKDFSELLSLENVALDSSKGHADIQKNADYIASQLQKRGLKPEIFNVEGGFPAVYAELVATGAAMTVIFYAHFDGQPVDATKWKTPPFQPVLFNGKEDGAAPIDLAKLNTGTLPAGSDDWRLYARSTGDDKAAVIGFLTALDALSAAKIKPSINVKFLFEGEEEAGSAHLGQILEKYKQHLHADLLTLCDGPTHQSGKLQLVYGVRGQAGVEMTVYGANRPLHSGHYGNWAPNPAVELAGIISSLRDPQGVIKIDGFYSSVQSPTAVELKALETVPNMDTSLRNELALGRTEGNGERLERVLMNPAMNVRGIRAGAVGQAKTNSIMTEATASIDFRLVPGQTPELVHQQLENTLTRMGYRIIHDAPTDDVRKHNPKLIRLDWEPGYPAFRTPLDSSPAAAVVNTIESSLQTSLIRLPTLGASIPMYLFADALKAPVVVLPIANYDNNQHSSNENIRLKNLWQGIAIYSALIAELGKNWQ